MENESTVKSGHKTTEFWTMLAGSLASILNQSGFLGSFQVPTETVVTMAGLIASYILSRGLAKLNAKKA